MQEVGSALGLGIKGEEFLDGGPQVGLTGALFLQEGNALLQGQIGRFMDSASTALGDGSSLASLARSLAEPHQPGPNVAPVPVQRALNQPQDRRGLIHRQAGEAPQ